MRVVKKEILIEKNSVYNKKQEEENNKSIKNSCVLNLLESNRDLSRCLVIQLLIQKDGIRKS